MEKSKREIISERRKKVVALIHTKTETEIAKSPNFIMDHITLEGDFKSWHYTDLNKKNGNRISSKQTKKITDSLYLWFLWGIKPMKLEPLPFSQIIYVYGPNEKEIRRRAENIVDARAGGSLSVLHINDQIAGPHYWNFQFYVHKTLVENDPNIAKLGVLPMFSPDHPGTQLEDRTIVQSSIVPIYIKGFSGTIFIMVNKIKSSMPFQSVMTPGSDIPDYALLP